MNALSTDSECLRRRNCVRDKRVYLGKEHSQSLSGKGTFPLLRLWMKNALTWGNGHVDHVQKFKLCSVEYVWRKNFSRAKIKHVDAVQSRPWPPIFPPFSLLSRLTTTPSCYTSVIAHTCVTRRRQSSHRSLY
jgi:hypothetical protein